jgi:endonuclease/exonuclease/phosphatase (EEP) superfamily protein YafD
MRRWRWASVSLVATLFNLWLLAPYLWLQGPVTAPPKHVHKFISANLLRENHDYERFVQFVREEKPDVLFVMEMNEAWTQALESLHEEYPHRRLRPREDAFGLGLFSRAPLEETQVVLSAAGLPSIVATMELSGGQTVLFIGTHPLPPMGEENATDRNEQLINIAQFVAKQKQPVVLLGDLNITPWSPHFRDLLRDSGLRDTQRGQGLQPSWPWLPWPCRIPIDHALVSKEVKVVERKLGPNIGSDHLPVVLEFVISE